MLTPVVRRPLGWILVVGGVLLAVFGLAVAIVFGPDNRVASGPHDFASTGAGVVTAPAALAYTGLTLHVTASASGRSLFVGLAHDVDVRDYLADTAFTRIDSIDVPWKAETTAVTGDDSIETLPADADFWLARDSGEGSASIRFLLPDDAVDVVVMDAEGKPDLRVELTVSVVQEGAFASGLALLVIGVGATVGGVLLLRHAPRRVRRLALRRRSGPPSVGRRRRTSDEVAS